jgi:hypothetical protein
MTKYTIHRLEAMERVKRFILDHPFAPAIPRADALVTQIDTALTGLQTYGGGQVEGFGTFQAGADDRAGRAAELFGMMRDLNQTARRLDRLQFPGVSLQFRLPRSRGYQSLLNSATAYLSAIAGPVKAAFIARGHPADFDEQLQAKIADLQTAVQRKNGGRQKQREGTVAQNILARDGMAAVRELGSIVNVRYRTADPALLEVWKAAARIERGPRSTNSTTPVPPPAAGPTPAPTPAPAPAPTT